MLPLYLAFAAVLFPFSAAGQNKAFTVESEVAVRAIRSRVKRCPN